MVEAVVLDLGGVLYEFQGLRRLNELTDRLVTPEEFSKFWSESVYGRQFMRGTITVEEFAKGALESFGLRCSLDQFVQNYRTWFVGRYDGALEIVRSLRTIYKVACLSNCSEIETSQYRNSERLQDIFDFCAFSNEIEMIKPEPATYRYIVEQLGIQPRNVLYLDNNLEFVEAAINVGLQSEVVNRPSGVRNSLLRHGISV